MAVNCQKEVHLELPRMGHLNLPGGGNSKSADDGGDCSCERAAGIGVVESSQVGQHDDASASLKVLNFFQMFSELQSEPIFGKGMRRSTCQ